jgi:hypothetical protein
MPTARFTLQTRSPESTSTSLPLPIHIRCRHFVNVLSSSDNIVTLRSAPAAGIKVELDGELPVVLSGFVRGVKIEQERLGSSGVARFFESFLREVSLECSVPFLGPALETDEYNKEQGRAGIGTYLARRFRRSWGSSYVQFLYSTSRI